MAQQVSAGGQWGREQLSGLRGQKPISRKITQDRAMALGGRIASRSEGAQSPARASA